MADIKFSALTAVSSIDGTQEYAVNDGGTSKKATGTQQAQYGETRLQQGVLCTHASDQTITTATWTELSFDTETWKVGDTSIHSTSTNNGRLIAQFDGEFMPYGLVGWGIVNGNPFMVQWRIRLNGTSTLSQGNFNSLDNEASAGPIVVVASIPAQLTSSDYITLEVRHNRGSNLDVLSANTKFGMYVLGR